MKKQKNEPWVGLKVVAKHMSVHPATVYRHIYENGFPTYKVGRIYRFKLSEVDGWMAGSRDQFVTGK